MKKILLAASFCLALASCADKNSEPAPAPTLTGGTWSFQSETIATTPKSGGSTTTTTSPLAPGSITIAFTDATHYTTSAAGLTGTGTYTYSANTINSIPDKGAAVELVDKISVSELSANKLVLTDTSEDTANRYVNNATFTR
jgi:hypothetical protein